MYINLMLAVKAFILNFNIKFKYFSYSRLTARVYGLFFLRTMAALTKPFVTRPKLTRHLPVSL